MTLATSKWPRVSFRTALPNATAKTLYMSCDGLGTAVSQSFTTDAGGTTTSVEKAGGAAFAATAVGCMCRCVTATNSANVGISRKVTIRDGDNDLTTEAYPANITAADTFVLERSVKDCKKARITVESGGHFHLSDHEDVPANTNDILKDDSIVHEIERREGFSQLNIFTDSDVSAIKISVEAE